MIKRIIFVAIALHAASIVAFGDEMEPRENRVVFGSFHTGQDMRLFNASHTGYTKAEEVDWIKFNADIFDYTKIWAPLPEKRALARRTLSHIKVIEMTKGKQACQSSPRSLFLKSPGAGGKLSVFRLYAYEFIICDNTKLLSPDDMIKQYVDKYGMYDEKDFDRKMIIYKNVLNRYRLGIRPYYGDKGESGLVMTVVDDDVFTETYIAWRGTLRTANEKIRNLF